MITLTGRQGVALLVIVVAAIATFVVLNGTKEPNQAAAVVAGIVAAGGILAVLFSAAGGPSQDVGAVLDGLRRARRGDRPAPPIGASPEMARVFDDLARFAEEEEKRSRDAKEVQEQFEQVAKKLQDGVQMQVTAADETARVVKDIAVAMRAFSSSVEALTKNAEES